MGGGLSWQQGCVYSCVGGSIPIMFTFLPLFLLQSCVVVAVVVVLGRRCGVETGYILVNLSYFFFWGGGRGHLRIFRWQIQIFLVCLLCTNLLLQKSCCRCHNRWWYSAVLVVRFNLHWWHLTSFTQFKKSSLLYTFPLENSRGNWKNVIFLYSLFLFIFFHSKRESWSFFLKKEIPCLFRSIFFEYLHFQSFKKKKYWNKGKYYEVLYTVHNSIFEKVK